MSAYYTAFSMTSETLFVVDLLTYSAIFGR